MRCKIYLNLCLWIVTSATPPASHIASNGKVQFRDIMVTAEINLYCRHLNKLKHASSNTNLCPSPTTSTMNSQS